MTAKLCFVIVLLFCALPQPARAALPAAGLTLTPALEEVRLEPSDRDVHYPVTITNHTDQSVTVRLTAFDLGNQPELINQLLPGTRLRPDRTVSTGVTHPVAWLTFERDVMVVPPQTQLTTMVTIANQANLAIGGHYAVVRVSTANESMNLPGAVGIDNDLLSLLFVIKDGAVSSRLELTQLDITTSPFKLPNHLRLEFTNTGNIHTYPRGRIELTDPLGRLIADASLNLESRPLLPGTTRFYLTLLQFQKRPFWPGRYQLTVTYRPDISSESLSSSRQFWYLGDSWWIGLLVLGLLGLSWPRRRRSKEDKIE